MEKTENCEECNNRFQVLWNKIVYFFSKKQKLIPKTEAFDESTYGKCMTKAQYIANKQVNINAQIREKIGNVAYNATDFEKYFLILPFNETEEECAEEILKPFIESGYKVEKISDFFQTLTGTNVYMLNWRKS